MSESAESLRALADVIEGTERGVKFLQKAYDAGRDDAFARLGVDAGDPIRGLRLALASSHWRKWLDSQLEGRS